MTPPSGFRYWAFVSYSQADRDWAAWLGRQVEKYRTPRRLVTEATRDQPIPRRFIPIFRDREELPASADLPGALRSALAASRFLIVICSPRAAVSRWVDEEIRSFKSLGRAGSILSLVVDGEPYATDRPDCGVLEAFPPALRYEIAPDGRLSRRRAEPLAADARKTGDGKRDALLKIVAGMLGVGFDTLKKRDRRRRRVRRAQIFLAGLGMLAVIGLIFDREWRRTTSLSLAIQSSEVPATDPVRKLALAIGAVRRSATFEAQAALRSALLVPIPHAVFPADSRGVFMREAVQSRDGRWVFAGGSVWEAATGRERSRLRADGGSLSAAFSPDGNTLVTGDSDHVVRVWDASSGEQIRLLQGHRRWFAGCDGERHELELHRSEGPRFVRFDSAGERIITGGDDGTLRIWRPQTGAVLHVLEGRCGPIEAVDLAPDGRRLLAASTTSTRIWDLETGEQLVELMATGRIDHATFDPGGERVAVASSTGVWVWDLTAPERPRTLNYDRRLASHFPVNDLAFGDGGRTLVTGGQHGVRIWRVDTGDPLTSFEVADSAVWDLSVSPDDRLLAAANSDGAVRVWAMPARGDRGHARGISLTLSGVDTRRPRFVIRSDPDDRIHHVQFSADGRWLITVQGGSSVRLWPVREPGEGPVLRGHGDWVRHAEFSPDMTLILTVSDDGGATIWDAGTGEAMTSFNHAAQVWYGEFGPDGKRVATASADFTASVWDPATGAVIGSLLFDVPEFLAIPCRINCPERLGVRTVRFNATGDKVVAAASDGSARILELESGGTTVIRADARALRDRLDVHHGTYDAAFLADGRSIATAGADGRLRIFDGESGERLEEYYPHRRAGWVPRPLLGLQVEPGAGLAMVSERYDRAVVIDLRNGDELSASTVCRQNSEVAHATLSPLARRAAAVFGAESNSACIWGPRTAAPRQTLKGHQRHVWHAAFDPEGERLVTSSGDGTARLWEVESGAPLAVLRGHSDQVLSARFSADGRSIVTASRDGTARLYVTHLEDLLVLAESRLPATLTTAERRRLIASGD